MVIWKIRVYWPPVGFRLEKAIEQDSEQRFAVRVTWGIFRISTIVLETPEHDSLPPDGPRGVGVP
jgi:hypothetical protein